MLDRLHTLLERARTLIPATARLQYYRIAVAAIVLLGGLGFISQSLLALWIAVAGASVTLLFALLHSLSTWSTAVYGLIAALAPLLLAYSIGTEQGWAAVITFAGIVFGVTTAASRTTTLAVPLIAWADNYGDIAVASTDPEAPWVAYKADAEGVGVDSSDVGRHRKVEE